MIGDKIQRYFEMINAGMVEDALQNLKKLYNNPLLTDDQKFEMAQYYYQYGYLEEAMKIVEELRKKYPDESELILLLADIYIDAGQEDEIISLLHDIQPHEENDYIRAILLTAEIYLMQGFYEVAEKKIKEALRYYPEERILHSALGEIFYHQENYALALTSFKKGSEVSTYAKIADCYAHLGQFEDAVSFYEKALTTQPDQVDLLFGYGLVLHQLQEYEKAVTKFSKVVEIDPFFTSVYPILVDCYRKMNQHQKALEIADKGLTYDQQNPQLFYIKGEILASSEQLKEAEKQFHSALQLDDQFVPALDSLIRLYIMEENWEDGIHFLHKLLEVAPERGDAYLQLGSLYEEMEAWKKAEEVYREAIAIDRENVEAINKLAFLLRDEGQMEEAMSLWRESLRIDPEQWEIEELLNQYSEQ